MKPYTTALILLHLAASLDSLNAFLSPSTKSASLILRMVDPPAPGSEHSRKAKKPNFAKDFFARAAKDEGELSNSDEISSKSGGATDKSMKIEEEEVLQFASDLRTQEEAQKKITSGDNYTDNTTPLIIHTVDSIKKISQKSEKVYKAIFNSRFGKRGELLMATQLFLLISIVVGHVPLLKDFFQALFGPVLFFSGLAVTGAAMREMTTTDASPFTVFLTPVPKDQGGKVIRTGVFEYVRHPIYAGNLASLVGWSIMSGSAMRMLLSLAYYVNLLKIIKKEEEEMNAVFGQEYGEYFEQVPNRFFPFQFLDRLFRKLGRSKKNQGGDGDGDDGGLQSENNQNIKVNASTTVNGESGKIEVTDAPTVKKDSAQTNSSRDDKKRRDLKRLFP